MRVAAGLRDVGFGGDESHSAGPVFGKRKDLERIGSRLGVSTGMRLASASRYRDGVALRARIPEHRKRETAGRCLDRDEITIRKSHLLSRRGIPRGSAAASPAAPPGNLLINQLR